MDSKTQNKFLEKAGAASNIVLLATTVVSLAVWFYCVYFYVWTGIRQFDSGLKIALFICLPLILALCTLGALRLSPLNRVSVALLWSSALASIYILEVLFTLWPPLLGGRAATASDKTERRQIAERFGINFDSRDAIEVVMDARSRGVAAVPAVFPAALLEQGPGDALNSVIRINRTETLPLAGVSNKFAVLCNESGEFIAYESDEHGFHNPKGLWNSDQVDIAVVGDSFVHGFCVPSEENFVSLIRRRYPATLSLGMGGNGPLLELAGVKEFLPLLKPKVVLWGYFEKNDFTELRNEAKSPLLLRYLKSSFRQDLTSRQNDLDQALLAHIEKEKPRALLRSQQSKNPSSFKKASEIAKLRTLRSSFATFSGRQQLEDQNAAANKSAGLVLFRAILQQAKTTVEAWGGSLYLVDLPPWERYAAPGSLKQNREQVLQTAAGLDIPIIDIDEAFRSHGDPLSLFPFRRSGHYNAKGNEIVAAAILERLAAERIRRNAPRG